MNIDDTDLQFKIDSIVEEWKWVIGGVVDNDPEYVRTIIHAFLGLPLPRGERRNR